MAGVIKFNTLSIEYSNLKLKSSNFITVQKVDNLENFVFKGGEEWFESAVQMNLKNQMGCMQSFPLPSI